VRCVWGSGALWLVVAVQSAQPAQSAAPVVTVQPVVTEDAATHLRRCDQLVSDGLVPPARACFEELQRRFPGTPEAHDAERALSLIQALGRPSVLTAPSLERRGRPRSPDSFYLLEPFSRQTHERVRLTTWEKLDFGITSFLYGMSTGLSAGLATDKEVTGPVVAGALVYTGLGVAYLTLAHPDRGDLPLVLAISSYLPLTVGLGALATGWDSEKGVPAAIAGTGVAALPIAVIAAANSNLDPGDTQLVRDAGFWGLVLSFSTSLAVNPESSRAAGVAGLMGLYGGLGLGLIAASASEVSLERVRVATWGGYGGALIGGLLGIAGGSEENTFKGVAVGAALGLAVAFIGARSLDNAPDNAEFEGASLHYLEPTLVPVVTREGRSEPLLGLSLARGRF
jgi:hypothetical protein